MRNYFKSLQQPTDVTREILTTTLALGSVSAKQITPRHRVDAYDVLLDEDRRTLYASTVELYEAMYIASARLQHAVAIDTHSWAERLADFDTAVEDSIELISDDASVRE